MTKWTREGIIRDILRREAEGLTLTSAASKDGIEHTMYQAASRIFGSWRNAIMAAGLPASRSRSSFEWTPARIRKLIRSLARRQRPLRPKELREKYGSFMQAARRHFGSWSKAVPSFSHGSLKCFETFDKFPKRLWRIPLERIFIYVDEVVAPMVGKPSQVVAPVF